MDVGLYVNFQRQKCSPKHVVFSDISLPFSVGEFEGVLHGLVSENIGEVMLGIDWMTNNTVDWEFGRSRIKIGKQYYSLKSRSSTGTWCRRVALQYDVVVPPRSEVDLLTTVVVRRLTDHTVSTSSEWGTEPRLLLSGVHTSRTVIPGDRLSGIPVLVMNVRSEDVMLRAETSVAELNPVSVVGPWPVATATDSRISTVGIVSGADGTSPQFIRDMVDKVDDSLPESTAEALDEILLRHSDGFSQSEHDLGLTTLVTDQIETANARPVKQSLRRFRAAHVEAISQQIDDYLKQGVIQPAISPWASNLVLVRKKDGSYRCCVDYRALNSVTRKDA